MRPVLCFLCLAALLAESDAGPAWSEYSGRCYLLSNTNMNLDQAEKKCREQGSALVELDSADEYLLVNEMLLKGMTDDVWVGLKNVMDDLVWTQSGITLSTTSSMWVTNEPNLSGKCVRLTRYYPVYPGPVYLDQGFHKLADISCSKTYRILCEKASSRTRSHGKRLTVLHANLSTEKTLEATSMLRCAQACAQQPTSCSVYGYEKSTSTCTFNRLRAIVSKAPAVRPGIKYYRLARKCA